MGNDTIKNTFKVKSFDPSTDSVVDNLIKFAVAPRPICFASTQDREGRVNLSPFSYFNLFSHNPPILVFAPVRRMRDSTTKHTLENLREVPEVVINIVNYSIVQQQSLASTEYEKGVNEFDKSGLTQVASELIAPPRVAESPVQFECRVREIIDLGEGAGHGSLVVAEVLRMHVQESVLDANGLIDQAGLDLVARLGADWYCRVTEQNLFAVPKPLRNRGIGVDQLPASIRTSTVLTGNHLGLLANVDVLPSLGAGSASEYGAELGKIAEELGENRPDQHLKLHRLAAEALDAGSVEKAWQILLMADL